MAFMFSLGKLNCVRVRKSYLKCRFLQMLKNAFQLIVLVWIRGRPHLFELILQNIDDR